MGTQGDGLTRGGSTAGYKMVKHKAWQVAGFPIPKVLILTACEMLQDWMQVGVFEPCDGPYQNLWFLTRKKNGKY